MSTEKKFNCLEMKKKIQDDMNERYKVQDDELISQERRKWLENSDDDLARWWRNQKKQNEAA